MCYRRIPSHLNPIKIGDTVYVVVKGERNYWNESPDFISSELQAPLEQVHTQSAEENDVAKQPLKKLHHDTVSDIHQGTNDSSYCRSSPTSAWYQRNKTTCEKYFALVFGALISPIYTGLDMKVYMEWKFQEYLQLEYVYDWLGEKISKLDGEMKNAFECMDDPKIELAAIYENVYGEKKRGIRVWKRTTKG